MSIGVPPADALVHIACTLGAEPRDKLRLAWRAAMKSAVARPFPRTDALTSSNGSSRSTPAFRDHDCDRAAMGRLREGTRPCPRAGVAHRQRLPQSSTAR